MESRLASVFIQLVGDSVVQVPRQGLFFPLAGCFGHLEALLPSVFPIGWRFLVSGVPFSVCFHPVGGCFWRVSGLSEVVFPSAWMIWTCERLGKGIFYPVGGGLGVSVGDLGV